MLNVISLWDNCSISILYVYIMWSRWFCVFACISWWKVYGLGKVEAYIYICIYINKYLCILEEGAMVGGGSMSLYTYVYDLYVYTLLEERLWKGEIYVLCVHVSYAAFMIYLCVMKWKVSCRMLYYYENKRMMTLYVMIALYKLSWEEFEYYTPGKVRGIHTK